MLRLKNLSNKYQKRTCRPIYANTQATPYAASLASTFRDSNGQIQLLTSSVDATRSADAYRNSGNSYVPGQVVTKLGDSETITIAYGNTTERPFGLLANFVGGDFDEGFNGDRLQNEVGVWRGPDSVFEILAPAYSSSIASAGAKVGTPLYAGTNGLLTTSSPGSGAVVVAYLIKKETNRILVDLAI